MHVYSLRQAKAKKDDDEEEKAFFEDALLLNLILLFSKLIEFDLLRKTGKKYLIKSALQIFAKLLEFDQKKPIYSRLLEEQREKNLKKALIPKKKNLFAGLKNAIGSIVSIKFPFGQKVQVDKSKIVDDEIDDQQANQSNPIIRSMITLNYSLERLKYNIEDKQLKVEIDIKGKICDTLDFLLDIRKNYLISNFLAWHMKKQNELSETNNSKKFRKIIIGDLNRYLPIPSKTGITEVDEYEEDEVEDEDENEEGFAAMAAAIKLKNLIPLVEEVKTF